MNDVPLLRADGLTRTYVMGRTRVEVLRGCALEIRRGEFLAIMGKSGSGKSTLLHLLGALDVPQRGQVWFEERPIFADERGRAAAPGLFDGARRVFDVLSGWERRRIGLRRRRFGFVFQFYHLLPELTVLENVLLPRMIAAGTLGWWTSRGAARRDAREIVARVGLEPRLKHRPAELSGGERQRVAIARALVHRPDVLFADEPTGNLDAQTGESLMELLLDLHRAGQTIVMVTHDPAIAARADRTLHLVNGRLAG